MFSKQAALEVEEDGAKEIHITTQISLNMPDERAPDVILPYKDNMPPDVTREILLRLPTKSLVRFCCVSKLWSSITNQPDFIKSFTTKSLSRPSLLIGFKKEGEMLFFSVPQHEIPNKKCFSHNNVRKSHISLPQKDGYMPYFESVQGLISFHHPSDHIIIWNPTIRQHVILPKPAKSGRAISYLGCDPIGSTYKLLCMPHIDDCERRGPDYGPQFLTLGVEEPWRMINEICMYGMKNSYKCINRVLYFEVCIPNDGPVNIANGGYPLDRRNMKRFIMSFNVRSEKFKLIHLPCRMNYIRMESFSLLNDEERLLLVRSSPFPGLASWILENSEEEEWSPKIFHISSSRTDSTMVNQYSEEVHYHLYDVIVNGEFIYLGQYRPWAVNISDIHLLYYEPRENSIRRFKLEGTGYKEIKWQDWFHNRPNRKKFWEFTQYCSPNHIENVVSLKNITCSSLV